MLVVDRMSRRQRWRGEGEGAEVEGAAVLVLGWGGLRQRDSETAGSSSG